MRHPIESLLRHHASFGTVPTSDELDDLALNRKDREKVKDAANHAARLYRHGDRLRADQAAHEASRQILNDLPEEHRDPRWGHRDPLADIDDPDELARHIRSSYGAI